MKDLSYFPLPRKLLGKYKFEFSDYIIILNLHKTRFQIEEDFEYGTEMFAERWEQILDRVNKGPDNYLPHFDPGILIHK